MVELKLLRARRLEVSRAISCTAEADGPDLTPEHVIYERYLGMYSCVTLLPLQQNVSSRLLSTTASTPHVLHP